ncbi:MULTISPECIES: thioredoxin-dependent thiol peroxidase [unclassified Microbacterium]|uniref:thioredoxin-dependent thiol peroxidase n=1 Tax=unclassified Microbacterium TaxID=2609290 RepID=UPI003434A96D
MTDRQENSVNAHLTPGDLAPAIDLPDADGHRVSLADRRGRGVVVYFYPRASTPGCTTEACDFRDSLSSLAAAGFDVLGVSPDPVEALQAFAEAEGLTFPLLSDADGEVARAYGAWGLKDVGGVRIEGVRRSTFVIDGEGRVRDAEYDVVPQGHVARLRESLGIDR